MAEQTGIVSSVNQAGTGINVGGTWYNFSNRTPVTKPVRGQKVRLEYEPFPDGRPGGFVQSLEVLDGGAVQQLPSKGGGRPGMSPEERMEIKRMNILRTAADFAGRKSMSSGDEIKSTDVLKIADSWLRWLENRGG